jgi:two-component system, OmpR family, response regulator ChvI
MVTSTTLPSDKQKARILVVDDEYDVAITLKTILEEEKDKEQDNSSNSDSSSSIEFEVDVFNDPKLALSNFKTGRYDLLLLDILMPKMNGFELCQQLKNIDDKVKICFITAYEVYYRALREMFPTMEVYCFIAKPIGKKELVSRVKEEFTSKRLDNK